MTVLATVATAAAATAVVPAVVAEGARRDSDLHVLDLPYGWDTQMLTAALDATRAEPGLDSRAVVICSTPTAPSCRAL